MIFAELTTLIHHLLPLYLMIQLNGYHAIYIFFKSFVSSAKAANLLIMSKSGLIAVFNDITFVLTILQSLLSD